MAEEKHPFGKLVVVGSPNQRTLADRAFTTLHDAIIAGNLEPGKRLPIEDISEALEMSPMPVREALRRLDSVGLVEHIPHRGARVTNVSVEDLRQVYEARLALEPQATARAAEKQKTENLEEAREALESLDKVARKGRGDIWPVHTKFHFAIYDAADSAWLSKLIRPVWETSERYRISLRDGTDFAGRHQEHHEILEAVEAGDEARASALMHNHLVATANLIAEKMRSDPLFDLLPVEEAA